MRLKALVKKFAQDLHRRGYNREPLPPVLMGGKPIYCGYWQSRDVEPFLAEYFEERGEPQKNYGLQEDLLHINCPYSRHPIESFGDWAGTQRQSGCLKEKCCWYRPQINQDGTPAVTVDDLLLKFKIVEDDHEEGE